MPGPVAVLGFGGIGGLVAARTGAMCVGTERTVAAVRAKGLTLVHGDSTTVVHPDAVERLDRPVSLLLVAVKSYGLEGAVARLAPEALAGAVILPLLNGLEHVDRLRVLLDGVRGDSPHRGHRVAAGSIGRVEATSPEPGVVVQRTQGDAVITASCRDLEPTELEASLSPLRVPGLAVVVGVDEAHVLWEKSARLAALAAATVASGLPVGALRADPAWRNRLRAAVGETCAVAAADGVELDAAGQWAIIEAMPADLTTSTARDAAAGRPTELDAIAGAVVRAANRLQVPVASLESLLAEARTRVGSPP